MRWKANMRTTLDLDRELLDQAKDILGAAPFTDTIETGSSRGGWPS